MDVNSDENRSMEKMRYQQFSSEAIILAKQRQSQENVMINAPAIMTQTN